MNRPQSELLLYFMDMLSDHLSCAGCNDMDKSVFDKMPESRVALLKSEFERWNAKANPEDYEDKPIRYIPDYLWLAFLRDALKKDLE